MKEIKTQGAYEFMKKYGVDVHGPFTSATAAKATCRMAYDKGWMDCMAKIGAPDINVGTKWIPCSERLPKCNGCYLVWRPHFFGGEIGMPAICYFDGQDTWHDSYGVDFTRILNEKDVIAWMPLPEPYKESED